MSDVCKISSFDHQSEIIFSDLFIDESGNGSYCLEVKDSSQQKKIKVHCKPRDKYPDVLFDKLSKAYDNLLKFPVCYDCGSYDLDCFPSKVTGPYIDILVEIPNKEYDYVCITVHIDELETIALNVKSFFSKR